MPLIKPRTRGKELVRHITRLDRVNLETLFAYAQFLGEPTEYVLNQLIESLLAKDKEFAAWRAEHSESFVPEKPEATAGRKRGATTARPPSPPRQHEGATGGAA